MASFLAKALGRRHDDGVATVAVVLAAGAGSRFQGDTHKLLAPFRSTTVIDVVLDNVERAGFDHVIVVTGAADIPADLLDRPGFQVVPNPRWADGQATSLQTALAAADALGADAVVVGLGDQPLVTTECWQRVAAGRGPITVATYDGERGNPVRLERSVWPMLPSEGDVGARHVLGQHPELISEVACEGSSADIDTQEDLDQWN
jgi:molybdenum cofactor cytidylyltransferase